ncbi:UFSP2 family protein [Megaselia abdita]
MFKLKITSFLLKRLEGIQQELTGCLFGVFYDSTITVFGMNVETTIGKLNYNEISLKFPAEMDLIGLVKFGDCFDEQNIGEILKDCEITDNPILLHCNLGSIIGMKSSIFVHGKLESIPFEVMEPTDIYNEFCFSRVCCNFNIYTEETIDSIKSNIQTLRKDIAANGALAFKLNKTSFFLTGTISENNKKYSKNAEYIENLITIVDQAKGGGEPKNKKNKATPPSDYEVLEISVLKNISTDYTNPDNDQVTFPALATCIRKSDVNSKIPLNVDAMAILYKKTKVSGLYDILIESVCRALRLVEQSLIEQLYDNMEISIPITYHFSPPAFGHFLSCVYLQNISDNEQAMQQKRKKLHHHFGLPITKPYFRRQNRVMFKCDIKYDSPLMNTHLGVKPSGVKDGKQYLVQGNYYYYHYMQQNVNDNGWGCAYRSLQTLCSWFNLQGYTSTPVPTHEDIQRYLVNIEDKPKTFINSKQWIGSTEVSMCLNGFLNVNSKIMHVSSGGDLSSKGSELALHFETQGTPIMIGGGVLAHTIIGIDFNSEKGDLKFLILDPHYTESEDLNVIQGKGWCGWKSTDFWDKKSYYNLCMPQRPIVY